MAKFKVGDKVRVRSDLNGTDRYYSEDKKTWGDCVSEMVDLCGKTVTIKEVGKTGKYRICEEGYSWTDEMFIGLATEQPRREFIVIHRDGNVMIAEHRVNRDVIKSAKATCSENDTFDLMVGAQIAFDKLTGRYVKPQKEPNPAPQPAHRFKVGDRVKTNYGIGTVVDIYGEEPLCSYTVEHDEPKNFMNDGQRGRSKKFKDAHRYWLKGEDLSPAPAPEPPKFYTGKVFAEKSTRNFVERDGKVFEFVNGFCVNKKPEDRMLTGEPISSIEILRENYSGTTWHEVKSDV